MSTFLPTTDKDAGVEEVYARSLRFLRRQGMRVDFQLDKPGAKKAIEELWDGIGGISFKELLSGTTQTAMPKEYLHLLVYAVIKTQLEQYVTTLPVRAIPDISRNTEDKA